MRFSGDEKCAVCATSPSKYVDILSKVCRHTWESKQAYFKKSARNTRFFYCFFEDKMSVFSCKLLMFSRLLG